MTRRELIERLIGAAEPVYGAREAAAIARLVALKRYGLTRVDCALEPGVEVDLGATGASLQTCASAHRRPTRWAETPPADGVPSDCASPSPELSAILADLAAARPVQYVLGAADFDGMELAVGEGVLIPRPETEELVRWIADDVLDTVDVVDSSHRHPLRCDDKHPPVGGVTSAPKILDIGTGSGAIAIALAKRFPKARVTAMDVSPDALRFARENAAHHVAGVEILEADVFAWAADHTYDIIVSNPPYIPNSEEAAMAPNVALHEPEGALFVPDDDPLIFYRAIARLARRSLARGGALYFEIHENFAREIVEMLEKEGFSTVEVRCDINSKPRMVRSKL